MKRDVVIVEDQDGGFILAEYEKTVENADEEYIKVYKYKGYYHTLESVVEDA